MKALEMDTDLSTVLDQLLMRWLAGEIELQLTEDEANSEEDEDAVIE